MGVKLSFREEKNYFKFKLIEHFKESAKGLKSKINVQCKKNNNWISGYIQNSRS